MVTVDFGRIDINPGSRVLDVGCGSGRHTAAAYRLPGARVLGVDVAADDLSAARERLQLHDRLGAHGGGRWDLCAADACRLPFADSSFDLVICAEVLEHVRSHGRVLSEIARVLRPGGDLAVSVPRYGPERLCWALSADYTAARGGHVRIYRERSLRALLRGAGLTPRTAHCAHSLHTPYWWLKCLVGVARDDAWPVRIYHRFLTWDIMRQPRFTRWLDRLLNPVLGKSLVVYCKKLP
ncbi:MAG: class I SAM-dependent methyltransferase [Desulfobacterales bacterium]|nr:class I SAM-dependent methyltransferase [Desulfobacterales bacterium]